MLFDLKGRRRRVVQVTYLLLAVLMGGGLVLFGIGGDVSGGLFDAFSDRSSSGNDLVEDRIEKNEEKVAANPKDQAALKALVRDWYQLANEEADPNTRQYTDEGKERLAEADEAWQRYLEVETRSPSPRWPSLMVQVYGAERAQQGGRGGRGRGDHGRPTRTSAQAYLQLVQFAALAGQDARPTSRARRRSSSRRRTNVVPSRQLVEQAKQPRRLDDARNPRE